MYFKHLAKLLHIMIKLCLFTVVITSNLTHAKVMLDHPELSTCYTAENPCSLMPIPEFSSLDITKEVFTSDLTYIVQEVQPAKYQDTWTSLENNELSLTSVEIESKFHIPEQNSYNYDAAATVSYQNYITYSIIIILLLCLVVFLLTYTPATKAWHTN